MDTTYNDVLGVRTGCTNLNVGTNSYSKQICTSVEVHLSAVCVLEESG